MRRTLKAFEYYEPETIAEAISLLESSGEGAKLLAGGTDLLVGMKRQSIAPRCLINLKRIPGLNHIRLEQNGTLRLGALATIGGLETSGTVQRHFPVLAHAAGLVGSVQVRHLATIGGNLCNASPAADIAPSLIALGAIARMTGSRGEEVVPMEGFFLGPGKTVLGRRILLEIIVPPLPSGSAATYLKQTRRRAMDLATVGVAAFIAWGSGVCREARISLGAVAPTPIRARRAECLLVRTELADEVLREAGMTAAQEARPISDIRGTAEYRLELVKVLVRRAVAQAAEMARAVST